MLNFNCPANHTIFYRERERDGEMGEGVGERKIDSQTDVQTHIRRIRMKSQRLMEQVG